MTVTFLPFLRYLSISPYSYRPRMCALECHSSFGAGANIEPSLWTVLAQELTWEKNGNTWSTSSRLLITLYIFIISLLIYSPKDKQSLSLEILYFVVLLWSIQFHGSLLKCYNKCCVLCSRNSSAIGLLCTVCLALLFMLFHMLAMSGQLYLFIFFLSYSRTLSQNLHWVSLKKGIFISLKLIILKLLRDYAYLISFVSVPYFLCRSTVL